AAPFGENIVSAVKAGPTEVTMPLFVTDITDNGVVSGDPSAASPEAGRIIAEGSLCCAAPMASALRSSSFRRRRGARRWPAQAACDMDGKASLKMAIATRAEGGNVARTLADHGRHVRILTGVARESRRGRCSKFLCQSSDKNYYPFESRRHL